MQEEKIDVSFVEVAEAMLKYMAEKDREEKEEIPRGGFKHILFSHLRDASKISDEELEARLDKYFSEKFDKETAGIKSQNILNRLKRSYSASRGKFKQGLDRYLQCARPFYELRKEHPNESDNWIIMRMIQKEKKRKGVDLGTDKACKQTLHRNHEFLEKLLEIEL